METKEVRNNIVIDIETLGRRLPRLIKNLVKVVSLIAKSFAKYGSNTLVASKNAQTTRM